MISILILSWNRPVHLFLTLISLKRVLKASNLNFETIVLDQNSDYFPKLILKIFRFSKIIYLKENVGMAEGWKLLFSNISSESKFVLQLENDWWCYNDNDDFLNSAIIALEKPNCAFVKLRKNYDFQAGTNMLNKEPQTLYPFPFHIFEISKVGEEYCLYSNSDYSCFTFNPTLMKLEFRNELESHYMNNYEAEIELLRSGEDLPTKYWESQKKWVSGIISNPSFIHIGFHSRRYSFIKLPFFFLIEIFKWFKSVF